MIKESIKKVFENKFVKVLFKISAEIFFVLFFFFLIILTTFYVISSYQDVLKKFGVYVEDDCTYKDSKISCSYVNITDKKEYNINLKNVSADIRFWDFFKFKNFIDLKVENLSGEYINDLTAPPSNEFKFIFPLYMFSSFVNFQLLDGSFKVKNLEKDLDLDVKGISGYNKQNKVYLNKLLILTFLQKQNIYTLNLYPSKSHQITVFPKEMVIENTKISYETILSDIKKLSIHQDKTIDLTSKITSEKYSYKDVDLYGLDVDLYFNMKKDKKIKIDGKIENILYKNNIQLSNSTLKSDFQITEKDKKSVLKGKSEVKIGFLKTTDIQLQNLFIASDIQEKDGIKVKGKYDMKLSHGDFEYNDKEKKLNINSSIPSLKNILTILPIKKYDIIKSLDGSVFAQTDYFIDKNQVNITLNGKNFTGIGLKYSSLSGIVNLSLKDYYLYTDLKGFDGDQTVYINGFLKDFNDIKKLSYNLNVNAKNFILQNIMYLKDVPLKTVLNASGRIYGDANNISMDFSGNAFDFSYEEISLKNLFYNFSFKNEKITVKANDGKGLNADFSFNIADKKTDLKINFTKQFDLTTLYPFLLKHSKDVFEKLIPKNGEGQVYITSIKDNWNVVLDIKGAESYLKDIENSIFANVSGFINPKDIKLNIDFYKDNLTIKDNRINKISGKINISNKNLKFSAQIDGLNEFKIFNVSAKGDYSIDREIFNVYTNLNLSDEKSNLTSNLNFKISGNLNDYKGSLSGFVKNDKKIDFSIDITGDKNRLVGYGEEIKFIEKDFNLNIGESLITINFNKEDIQKSFGNIIFKNILLKEKDIPLIKFSDLKLSYYDKKIYTDKQIFTGSFVGSVEKFLYDLDKNYLDISVSGNLDRKYISQIIQYINVDGKIKFAFAYKGVPQDITEKASFKLYGEDVRIRTPYTANIISFDKFDITLKNSLYIDIKGLTRSSYGESSISVNGIYNLKNREGDIKLISELLPVRYENIYNGVISTNTDIKIIKEKIYINSKTLTTGKAKIEPDYLTQKTEGRKPEILKNIYLNINLSTLSPIFIEGSWGRVYGEGRFDIKGTAEKPIINGNFRMSYGKIDFLKNRYNVDFIDIKVADSKTYLNGRLSTNVSGTYIYVNVSGTTDNLRYDFFSTPPKSKDEILALLLIKKTPEQLASSGLFSVVGSVAKMITPFKVSEEEEGLFGTGFNVNILPSYNPVQGITFNIYVQKYLTRKIYLGFSKPITTTLITQYGFYEVGYKLTERSSAVFRLYDNSARSTELTFTLPFDF